METSGWGWRDNQILTALVFFFSPDRVYTHGSLGGKMSPSADCYWPFVIFLVYSTFLYPQNINRAKALSRSLLQKNILNEINTFQGEATSQPQSGRFVRYWEHVRNAAAQRRTVCAWVLQCFTLCSKICHAHNAAKEIVALWLLVRFKRLFTVTVKTHLVIM